MSQKRPRTAIPAGDLGSHWDTFLERHLPSPLGNEVVEVDAHIREGRFQRALSLMAGTSSILAGLEVSYEHYKGSYGQKVMWSPVVLSGAMTGAGIWGFFSTWAARTVLRWTSAVTLLDSLIGFFFHVRGVARKPGGWRLPVANVVMGPPIFAPLLFGVSAYLGPRNRPGVISIISGASSGRRKDATSGLRRSGLPSSSLHCSCWQQRSRSRACAPLGRCCRWSPSPPSWMEVSAFTTTRAAFSGARADQRSFFLTSFTGRRFLRRSFLPRAVFWDCSRA